MKDSGDMDMFSLLAPLWEKALGEMRYRDALMIALVGFASAKEAEPRNFTFGPSETVYLAWIRKTIHDAQQASGAALAAQAVEEKSCSFCGRREPEVRLVLGAAANICDACTATAADTFKS